jgi:hypothetical protein
MLKKILIGVAALVALVLAFAATKPDTFSVQRSIAINAAPPVIHPLLSDFHRWTAWSPWEKMDPDMQRTYEGPAAGKGARYAWEGDSSVGQGRMEITAETPTQIDVRLDFMTPMEMTSHVTFELQPRDDATQVVWTMAGENNYVSKVMQVFMSMDSMVGKDFESGLADLKTVAEKAAGERQAGSAAPIPTASTP